LLAFRPWGWCRRSATELPQDVVVKRPTSQYSESIRSIRTALRYSISIIRPSGADHLSLAGEGKTVFATSLAAASPAPAANPCWSL